MFIPGVNSPVKNTSYKVVLPFYGYAALAFLVATVLMLSDVSAFTLHYFNPHALAITHVMALGWGTMIILGASHQLFPVMIEGKLYSNFLAYSSFAFAAIGVPVLVFAFYKFEMGKMALIGALLVNFAVLCYFINLGISIYQSKSKNVHAVFAFTSVLWLFTTTILGLLLVWNFTSNILPTHSVNLLSLHAHLGIIGWFLLMVLGVGSRLIPMFLISKYENQKRLWLVFILANLGLLSFIALFFLNLDPLFYVIPISLIAIGILIFGNHIYWSYAKRIRKKVDEQVKVSIASVVLILVPILVLLVLVFVLANANTLPLAMLYGFTIFFGWITTIILGMTFKTLPFIVWNKVYRSIAGLGKTPNPKDLFNNTVFKVTAIAYLLGFLSFGWGIVQSNFIILNLGAFLLLITAILYNFNVFKILLHKAKINEYKN